MEDWKVARDDEGPSSSATDLIPPPSQSKLMVEEGSAEFPRHSSASKRRSSFMAHRISINPKEDDWDEEDDNELKNMRETAYTLMDKECATDEIIRVWECVSKFIIFKMLEGKAVRIAGLGTFTFRIHKMPVNQKEVKISKVPIFLLSEYVAQMYRLKQDKMMLSNVPFVALNLSVIAIEAKLPRGIVDGILTEVLQAFARGIACNKSLEFPFPFIGKLQIRHPKVVMRFYDEFCKKLGFHVVETTLEEKIVKNMIPGRMTPLRKHIPSENFRSVFHLREVRSVHEQPLLVPLVRNNGKLIPETLLDNKEKSKAPKEILRKVKPLYEAQKTGDCILDLMNSCPEIMTRCLRSHMYKTFVETLGAEVVKKHFHRRGNKGPVMGFSYSNAKIQ